MEVIWILCTCNMIHETLKHLKYASAHIWQWIVTIYIFQATAADGYTAIFPAHPSPLAYIESSVNCRRQKYQTCSAERLSYKPQLGSESHQSFHDCKEVLISLMPLTDHHVKRLCVYGEALDTNQEVSLHKYWWKIFLSSIITNDISL